MSIRSPNSKQSHQQAAAVTAPASYSWPEKSLRFAELSWASMGQHHASQGKDAALLGAAKSCCTQKLTSWALPHHHEPQGAPQTSARTHGFAAGMVSTSVHGIHANKSARKRLVCGRHLSPGRTAYQDASGVDL